MKVDLSMIMDILTDCISLAWERPVAGSCHEICAVPQQLVVPWLSGTGAIAKDHSQQGVGGRGRNPETPTKKCFLMFSCKLTSLEEM